MNVLVRAVPQNASAFVIPGRVKREPGTQIREFSILGPWFALCATEGDE